MMLQNHKKKKKGGEKECLIIKKFCINGILTIGGQTVSYCHGNNVIMKTILTVCVKILVNKVVNKKKLNKTRSHFSFLHFHPKF